VRTDPQAQKAEGIFLSADRHEDAGDHGRPIVTIDGGREVNEVFFDDLKTRENLVGEENKGWDYAKYLLGRERTGIARVGFSKERIGGSRSSPANRARRRQGR